MNQILVTGEDNIVKQDTKVKFKDKNKNKKTVPTNVIVIFFAISIIILGICAITGAIYANKKINASAEAKIKPNISIEKSEDGKTLKITVTHIRGIKTLTYKWNDGEESMIDGRDNKTITKTLDLMGGTNKLTVTATDNSGQTSRLEESYTVANLPVINLEAVENGVKIIATCEENIEYVQYSWDDGEVNKIEVGKIKYEGTLNAPKGKHTLKLEVVGINGGKTEKTTIVVGDTEPTLNVQSQLVNDKATFVIDAEDDENIKTIEITHNGGEKQVIEVNQKKYHAEVVMTEGEENRIIVTVTNVNDLQKTRRIKFNNK